MESDGLEHAARASIRDKSLFGAGCAAPNGRVGAAPGAPSRYRRGTVAAMGLVIAALILGGLFMRAVQKRMLIAEF